jgi:hypothetical protein
VEARRGGGERVSPSELYPSGFYTMTGQRPLVKFDEFGRVNLIGIFPSVVAFGVALPFDQILPGLGPPPGPMGTYLLHFIFFFPINQVRWRSGKVWAV